MRSPDTLTQEEMELEECNERLVAIENEREALAAMALPIKARRDELAVATDIARRVARMNDADKAALFQDLRAQGVTA